MRSETETGPVAPSPTLPLEAQGSNVRDWLQLCRLPNVFTAIADPLAGALIAGAGIRQIPHIIVAMLASASLYAGGMILNDWHDFKVDLRERPQRPLPSGRIRRRYAFLAVLVLLFIGPTVAFLAGEAVGNTAVFLAVTVITYDTLVKELPIAPVVMAACRSLNLLMGMMIVPTGSSPLDSSARFLLFLLMGSYILGVSLVARREVSKQQNKMLLVGVLLTWGTLLFVAATPFLVQAFKIQSAGYGYIWLVLLLLAVGFRMSQALFTPQPSYIQAAVKTAIMGIIVFDAALVGFGRGMALSSCVILLLIPSIWLGKWLYST